MATRTLLIDDMDGSEADRTVSFALEGQSYTLDLSEKNASSLRAALKPFIEAATRVKDERSSVVQQSQTGIEQRAAIRAWARKRGLDVAERGRIPADVVDAFNAAHKR